MIYHEQLLSAPVSKLLESHGFKVFTEVPYYRRSIDIVGVHQDHREVIAVELKVSVTTGVINQALKNQSISDHSYVAVAGMPKNTSINRCEAEGIGLIAVTGSKEARYILRPKHRELLHYIRRRRIEVAIGQMKSGGTAGLPCNSMDPKQAMASLVKAFIAKNPGASWQTVWEHVPNDYKHPNSLAAAMHRAGVALYSAQKEISKSS